MAKKRHNGAKKPTIVKLTPPPAAPGRHGRQFHALRAPHNFATDPPGFSTEVDPRKQPSNQWFDLPPATGAPPYRMDLSQVLADAAMQKIQNKKRMVFHAVGDTGGVNTTTYQQNVATYMELDFQSPDQDGSNPSFFYHLGDVVYYDGEIRNYYWEFYEPYMHYPAPIVAIPGNHDGDVDPNDQFNQPSDSLKGFVRNFCAQAAVKQPEADDAPRDAMTQPNVYWTLTTPLATIVGLYTNVPEGGKLGSDQISWLEQELADADKNLWLILALHHPPYSAYGHHPGSLPMKTIIEQASAKASRVPDLILSGHVHDYQRFNGNINGESVPCIVAGAGGYNQKLHMLDRKMFDPKGVPYQVEGGSETLESFNDFQHGYLLLDVTPESIEGRYVAVDDPAPGTAVPTKPAAAYDTFSVKPR